MKITNFKLPLLSVVAVLLFGCGYHDEEHERNVLNGMLVNEEYGKLETALSKANGKYDLKKLPPNIWAARFHTLADINADNIIVRFDSWVEEKDSGYAHLARGMFLLVQAWEARGSKLAAQTSDAQFNAFRNLATRAQADLTIAGEKLTACALCAGELITANRALGGPPDENASLLEAAIRYDPYMERPILNFFPSLFPQWGGSFEEMESFISAMRNKVKDPAIIDKLESRMCWERGRQAEQEKNPSLTFEWYQRGVNAHPYDMLMKNLAEIHSKNGDHQQAAAILEKNIVANGEWDLYTTEALAQAYYSLGDNNKGDKMMKKRDELHRRYNAFE